MTDINRREVLAAGIGVAAAGVLLGACSKSAGKPYDYPRLLPSAPPGPLLKAGLVGCGARGTGAAVDFLGAGPNVEVTALADLFEDRLNSCKARLEKKMGKPIAQEQCYLGFDAYQKLLQADIDVVLLATPPVFRPIHIVAAIESKKHLFAEKPVAVDAQGVRSVLASAQRAEQLGLSVATGTQRRHQPSYLENYRRVADGAIGEIIGGVCYWHGGPFWGADPTHDERDMESMVRNWAQWLWLSGDINVESQVHQADVLNWFIGAVPQQAIGLGGWLEETSGDAYNHYSVDYQYPNGVHAQLMCRRMAYCDTKISEWVRGTKGYTNCRDTIYRSDGSVLWRMETPELAELDYHNHIIGSPFHQEHIDWVTSIREAKPRVELEATAFATLTAIMGRDSAQSGSTIAWETALNGTDRLGPSTYALGPVDVESERRQPEPKKHNENEIFGG